MVLLDSLFGFNPNSLAPGPLGRRVPTDFSHVEKHRLITTLQAIAAERVLPLPWWHWSHDQGSEGACVGHGASMERAIYYLARRSASGQRPHTVRFDPWWLWDQAKLNDGWPDTNPGDENGTSVHAAYDVLRAQGHVRNRTTTAEGNYGGPQAEAARKPDPAWGVLTNDWATSVDQIRLCISNGMPVTIGVNWYTNFDSPVAHDKEFFVGLSPDLGTVRGGHCVCLYGASDTRQAFALKNSWGRSYPLVWLPYTVMDRLLKEDGEACVVTASR